MELNLEDDQYISPLQLFLSYMFTNLLSTKNGLLGTKECLVSRNQFLGLLQIFSDIQISKTPIILKLWFRFAVSSSNFSIFVYGEHMFVC